ncbi:MAG: protein phosphatase 2C domain-containing protein [Defluviitaleaceae bacterium]|nr:protein phosphatase 2C domain-containing protein [Defluviitaleaceae bacterium]
MILAYGFSLDGPPKEREADNQDDFYFGEIGGGVYLAVVADGVGSSKHSDVAANMAVMEVKNICEEGFGPGGEGCDFVDLLKNAFEQAELAIDKYALEKEHPISHYDTTLTAAIYDGKTVTYGHCGDGGIIGLTTEGDYIKITEPQKKEGIYVVPLRSRDEWEFGQLEDEFASVLLATDGVYDVFFPYLLRELPTPVHVPLAEYFMNNYGLKATKKRIQIIEGERKAFLESPACASIADDKTIVVLINADVVPTRKEADFYAEPDWASLKNEWDERQEKWSKEQQKRWNEE